MSSCCSFGVAAESLRAELSPADCGEAISRRGETIRTNKNEVRGNAAVRKRKRRHSKRFARWLGSKGFTLQGWGLAPLGRKFFPWMPRLNYTTHMHSQVPRHEDIRQHCPHQQNPSNGVQGSRWVGREALNPHRNIGPNIAT